MRLVLLVFLSVLCTCVCAQDLSEEITHFSVELKVRQDASLDVTETLTVVAAGDQIKRGITRALNVDPLGTDSELAPFTYEVLSVTRDGNTEPYHVKKRNGLPTVFVGDKDVFLEPGSYTYVVKYRAENQVYPVGVTDEIRWPLEGLTGSLPVRDADITIEFDRDISILQSACYTGKFGSTAEDCEFSQDGNVVTFVATRGLNPGEGMTVSASISQGYFQRPEPPKPPTPFEKNAVLYTMLLGLGIAASYAYSMWKKHGVDPKGPEVKMEFYPPEGFSPASVGLIHGLSPAYGPVMASLTDLAIKGYLNISEEKKEGFFSDTEIFVVRTTDKYPATGELPAEQQVLYDGMAAVGKLELKGAFDEEVRNLTNAHNEELVEVMKPVTKDGQQFVGVLKLGIMLLITIAVAVAFFIAYGQGAVVMVIGICLAVIGFSLYIYLIQQPSLSKVTLRRHIKGLKKYLALSEKKRRAISGAPPMTEEYFQSLLPYAIAMGVNNNWAEDLASDWSATATKPGERVRANSAYMAAGFSSRLGTSYTKSAAHAASSGGGGGGFASGGGSVGGGGGTGGW